MWDKPNMSSTRGRGSFGRNLQAQYECINTKPIPDPYGLDGVPFDEEVPLLTAVDLPADDVHVASDPHVGDDVGSTLWAH